MRIELRDDHRRRIGRLQVDPALRPTRVTVVDSEREVFLSWDTALDDAGHLRRCVACGCPDVFREKAFPQVTGFIVFLAFAGAGFGTIAFILGFPMTAPVLAAMAAVLVLDTGILLFTRQRLACYRCRTSYHGLPIARYHEPWDRSTADRYPAPERNAAARSPLESVRARLRGTAARSTEPAREEEHIA